MKLVSTQKTKETYPDVTSYDDRPRVYLDDDLVERLGLAGIPAPGTVFTLQAKAVAESVTASVEETAETATEGNKPDVRICLVLAEIGVAPASASDAERASMLYGEDE